MNNQQIYGQNMPPPDAGNRQFGRRQAARNASIALPVGMMSTFVVFFVLRLFPPLRQVESVFLATLYTAPLWLGIFIYIWRASAYAPSLAVHRAGTSFGVTLTAWAFIILAFFVLNARLDRHPAQAVTLPVTGADYSCNKHGSGCQYYAYAVSTAPARLFSKLILHERAEIPRSVYTYFDGRGNILLSYKPGFLGFPWLVSAVYVAVAPYPRNGVAAADTYMQLQIMAQNKAGTTVLPFQPAAMLPPDTAIDVYERLGSYYYGLIPPKYDLAAVWFQRAGEAGSASAQRTLGAMYYYSQGVAVDAVASANWTARAAMQGTAQAEDDLGVMYGNGHGVPQDWMKSYMWISLPPTRGSPRPSRTCPWPPVI